MKIGKLFNSKTRLIELILINFFLNSHNNIKFSDIKTRIKKILHIVYKYHMLNKKILFLGTPIENHFYIEKFLKQAKHIAIPESIWVNGLITNKKSCFKYLVKKQTYSKNNASKLLLKLNEPIDLILVVNNIENKSLLHEIFNSQIPIIYLNDTLGIELKSKKIVFNFFFSVIKTIIKKTALKKFKLNLYNKLKSR
jgi:ribosomal protein S2